MTQHRKNMLCNEGIELTHISVQHVQFSPVQHRKKDSSVGFTLQQTRWNNKYL